MDRASQLKAYVGLTQSIRASEEWHPSYKSHRAAFRELVHQEAELQAAAGEYLYALSQRVAAYVNWTTYEAELSKLPTITAASKSDPVLPSSDDAWPAEGLDLTRYIIDIINTISLIGVDAAIERYTDRSPIAGEDLLDLVVQTAEEHVAALVTAVTDTTREKIRQSIAQSLRRGETTSQAIVRLRDTINSPVRAEMIAQTESVNAYSLGQYEYARSTGAKMKIWEALAGACAICAPLDGKKIKLDGVFVLGDRREIRLPSAHPRCRCSVYFEY